MRSFTYTALGASLSFTVLCFAPSLAVAGDLLSQASQADAESSYKDRFKSGIRKGCLSNPPPTQQSSADEFCTCYSTSFADRYTEGQLKLISAAASESRSAAKAISLMMSPELESCLNNDQ